MSDRLRISVGQLNATLGDLAGNREQAVAALQRASAAESDLLLLPEMFLTGYPLQDLAVRPALVQAAMDSARQLAQDTQGTGVALAVGGPLAVGGDVYNALYVMDDGVIRAIVRKHRLPNRGVFDEVRTYTAGGAPGPVRLRGVRIGFAICEDCWSPDVTETLAESGAELIAVVNGSPYEWNKSPERQRVMVQRVLESDLPLIYVNLVGGQDDQVFDGGSFAVNPGGMLAMQAPFFTESVLHTDWTRTPRGWQCQATGRALAEDLDTLDYTCLVTGLRDFARKNGFRAALLGLSGGVDSALVAAIAADALGPENLRCVLLPSTYTSTESVECAKATAAAIGCRLDTLPIHATVGAAEATLAELFGTAPDGIVAENLQARARGILLMAIANKKNELLLATGNKSESAVGYATIYGDMCGGYAPLKDVYKTRVYALAGWRNAHTRADFLGRSREVVPERVLLRAPTAELRHDQRDQDSLPDYAELDAILEILVEEDGAVADAVAAGYSRATVERVAALLNIGEFKRYQSPPGPKLTRRAFWLERRYPVTNRFRELWVEPGEAGSVPENAVPAPAGAGMTE